MQKKIQPTLGPLSAVADLSTQAPSECGWIEYKHNYVDPIEIGETLSALANGAALADQRAGFLCWGVDDYTRKVVGTAFDSSKKKVGNEELLPWLMRQLHPRMPLRVENGVIEGASVVVFEIPAATHTPVRFQSHEYVRVGSYVKKLIDYPEIQKRLWERLRALNFEVGVAAGNVSTSEVIARLDIPAYFGTTRQPLESPDSEAAIARLVTERFLCEREGGRWDITNLGALLYARDLGTFPSVARKAIRVVFYQGNNKGADVGEHKHPEGYAIAFPNILRSIIAAMPTTERIVNGIRESVSAVPEISVRELLANALIHQDLNFSGAGPMVNVFLDRTEITNPGSPFVEIDRLMDLPPRSRNEMLAGFLRRIGYCEERGAGITRVFKSLEQAHLPAATFHTALDSFVAIISGPLPLSALSRRDKVEACYWHACLKYVSHERMTNTSLRRRLRISDKNYAMASRIISEAIQLDRIREYDPTSGKRSKSYIPSWAPEGAIQNMMEVQKLDETGPRQ
jgi:ATP-dependent DNA helicase RecG